MEAWNEMPKSHLQTKMRSALRWARRLLRLQGTSRQRQMRWISARRHHHPNCGGDK